MRPWAVLVATLAVLQVRAAHAEPRAVVFDRIVAVVDGEPILLSTLRQRAVPWLHESSRMPEFRRREARRKVYRKLLSRLIEERLVARAARDSGLRMDRTVVDHTIDAIAKQNAMSRSALLERVRAAGVGEEQYRAELRSELLERDLLWTFMQQHGVPLDGKGDRELSRIMQRERKRWMADLRRHASIQQYFRP